LLSASSRQRQRLPDHIDAFFTRDVTSSAPWEAVQAVQGGFLVARPSPDHFALYQQFILQANYTPGRGPTSGRGGMVRTLCVCVLLSLSVSLSTVFIGCERFFIRGFPHTFLGCIRLFPFVLLFPPLLFLICWLSCNFFFFLFFFPLLGVIQITNSFFWLMIDISLIHVDQGYGGFQGRFYDALFSGTSEMCFLF